VTGRVCVQIFTGIACYGLMTWMGAAIEIHVARPAGCIRSRWLIARFPWSPVLSLWRGKIASRRVQIDACALGWPWPMPGRLSWLAWVWTWTWSNKVRLVACLLAPGCVAGGPACLLSIFPEHMLILLFWCSAFPPSTCNSKDSPIYIFFRNISPTFDANGVEAA